MPSRQSRLRTLSPDALARLAKSLITNQPVFAYDAEAMQRRRAAICCLIDPASDPAETARVRRHIGWPVEGASARRIWALRRQRLTLQALRNTPRALLP